MNWLPSKKQVGPPCGVLGMKCTDSRFSSSHVNMKKSRKEPLDGGWWLSWTSSLKILADIVLEVWVVGEMDEVFELMVLE